jgi:hypothetical protein
MDEARFDQWTQRLGDHTSRRGLGGLAVGALAAIGVGEVADAKGKKKKGKKKKKKGQASPPPPPPPPVPRECVELGEFCDQESDSCCTVTYSTSAPICDLKDEADRHPICCLPPGSRTTDNPVPFRCCGGGWKPDGPDPYNGPGTCCVSNDWPLHPGQSADLCCTGPYTFQGRCALPPGHTCYQDHFSLCWDGSTCNGNRCPDA